MIEAHHLSFWYPGVQALREVSFKITRGMFLGLLGPNGSGKSTLLKLMAGVLPVQHGRLLLDGRPLSGYSARQLARKIGYVPQEFSPLFNYTVQELVQMGRYPHLGILGRADAMDQRIVQEVMEQTEIWGLRDRRFHQLSGGERQRVILAAALAQQPGILLLDEPTRGLDIKHQLQFLAMLQALQKKQGLTVVLVTHDLNLAYASCTHLMFLKQGHLVSQGKSEQLRDPSLLEQIFEAPFRLVQAFPESAPNVLVDYSRISSIAFSRGMERDG